MLVQLFAWMGLIAVLLTALHWALDSADRRGWRLPAWLSGLLRTLDRVPQALDGQQRAERRRAERVRLARQQREAIARNSVPGTLDDDDDSAPPVEWDGNVARPQFGGGSRRTRPHNLH